MANPFIGAQPIYADIGYPQVQYQSTPQDIGSQEQFHNQAFTQMQQLGTPSQASGINPLALAQALRAMPENQFSGLTPQQTWDMTYGTQAQPYQGGATFGVNAAQNYDYWK